MPSAFTANICLGLGMGYDPARNRCVAPNKLLKGRKSMTSLPTRRLTLPAPTTVGSSNPIDVRGFAEEIGGDLVDVGIEWVRGRLSSTGNGNGNGKKMATKKRPKSGGTNVVPGVGDNVVPGSNLVGAASCPDGSFPVFGRCIDLIPGGSVSGGGMVLDTGEAVMGRYGAALVPMRTTQEVARCPRGAVLANDGLCYNRSQLRKSDRKWIPARKPLLTGGDLNAIARASRAANRVKVQQKRLQKLGLLAKPKAQRRAPQPGHHHHDHD
jgi:hypothetical protein